MRIWRSYRRLNRDDRRLAVETAAALLATRVGLRLVGLPRWRAMMVWQTTSRKGAAPASIAAEVGRKVAAIQEAVLRHLPWQPSCLEKSLVLWWQLGRRGIAAELRIGARKEAGRFEAHAWVEMGDVVLDDSGETHMHYAPFDGSILTLET
jgi:hypothetical protein